MKPLPKTIWIVFFALAMGYLESAVVVYLRELYYPEGFDFPMKEMSRILAVTELFREAATLIMILDLLSVPENYSGLAGFLPDQRYLVSFAKHLDGAGSGTCH